MNTLADSQERAWHEMTGYEGSRPPESVPPDSEYSESESVCTATDGVGCRIINEHLLLGLVVEDRIAAIGYA